MRWIVASAVFAQMWLAAVSMTHAAVYKWTDDQGKVHYSDKPHGSAVELDLPSIPASTRPTPTDEQRREKQRKVLEAFEKQRRETAVQKAKQKADKHKQAKRCADLKQELNEIENATYLYDVDEYGNQIVYSHQQRADITAAMRKQLADEC